MSCYGTDSSLILFTIGHSTRPIETFLALLAENRIQTLVDVRTMAGSRYNPQYNGESLSQVLKENGISYMHLKGLGGLRKSSKASINTGWRNLSFRGYADYMQTPEYAENLERLIEIANKNRVVIMCAEAVPWRCHRSLIADSLVIRNVVVKHIMSEHVCNLHRLTPFAKVEGCKITYP